jgi:uncharacterized protein YukE
MSSLVAYADGVAVDAGNQMKNIVQGGLTEAIQQLYKHGETLASGEHWKGQKAQEFQGEWQQMRQTLDRALKAVEELRAKAEKTVEDIERAAGNR